MPIGDKRLEVEGSYEKPETFGVADKCRALKIL
jgi:hypothetical protein